MKDHDHNGHYDSLEIAITVDDLPRHGDTVGSYDRCTIAKEFLKSFQKHNISSVIGFVNGVHFEKFPQDELVFKLWIEAGNFLGNHTYSHLDFSKVEIPEYISDIEKNESIIYRHQDTSDVFRYPYLAPGETEHKQHTIKQYLKEKNYKIALLRSIFMIFFGIHPFVKVLSIKILTRSRRLKNYTLNLQLKKLT
ncbi:MAG: polysaccharide deacetylase family protein [Tatlockia sp.]|nr:polysaccharide deacetylase family protein [Tatlockia sp.]